MAEDTPSRAPRANRRAFRASRSPTLAANTGQTSADPAAMFHQTAEVVE
jgi:hypothetical protein